MIENRDTLLYNHLPAKSASHNREKSLADARALVEELCENVSAAWRNLHRQYRLPSSVENIKLSFLNFVQTMILSPKYATLLPLSPVH